MKADMVTNGNPWGHPYKAINVLCFDGKRRTVRLNQQADSYFSWSGRCAIKGKTIRGYVSGLDTFSGKNDDMIFRLFDSSWEKIGMVKPIITQDVLAKLHDPEEITKHMIQDDYAGYPWGTTMQWLFSLCEYLHFKLKVTVPYPWQYKPGPHQTENDEIENALEDYYEEFGLEYLLNFGYFLNDLAEQLRKAGQNY